MTEMQETSIRYGKSAQPAMVGASELRSVHNGVFNDHGRAIARLFSV